MGIKEKVSNLLNSGSIRKAGTLLDNLISKDKSNHYLWYLRGVVSLEAKNYNNALECFERALSLKKHFEYFRAKGIVHFRSFNFQEAIIEFNNSLKLKDDSESYFFIGLCLVFLDDPKAKEMMKKAYLRNSKKTKKLLLSFYKNVLEKNWELTKNQKQEFKALINSIKD